MTIYIGSDHAGFKLKEAMKHYLKEIGVQYQDLGDSRYNKNDDYPIYAEKVAKAAAKNKSFGILFCGTAQGMCIAANKIKGIRAVVVHDLDDARITRTHNDANILCLSGEKTSKELSKKIIKTFLFTMFSGEERHKRRLKQISRLE
ncbi:RpiB/LacA/LacB family sugar-phosphate isomerase [Candidatus Woesearchaeota archaeon]|nr:RpiB/LacA/LacB family sugar-phosphate isomerase [Candidatus Woesearchaeota archaeon]